LLVEVVEERAVKTLQPALGAGAAELAARAQPQPELQLLRVVAALAAQAHRGQETTSLSPRNGAAAAVSVAELLIVIILMVVVLSTAVVVEDMAAVETLAKDRAEVGAGFGELVVVEPVVQTQTEAQELTPARCILLGLVVVEPVDKVLLATATSVALAAFRAVAVAVVDMDGTPDLLVAQAETVGMVA
jgi:hypothetical protein